MSDDESSNASSGKDSLYEEPEYDSDGNIVERGEEPESSVLEEDEEEDDRVEEEQNWYMALRAERIARNNRRLIALGLVRESGKKKTINFQLLDVSQKKRSAATATPPCTSPPPRKSPRLQQLLSDRTINLCDDNVEIPICTTTTTTTPLVRRRLWNSDIARAATQVGKARKIHNVAEFGEMSVIHPVRLVNVKVKDGMVKEESKELFFEACEAYVRHHAEYNCRNYQKKTYVTKCTCVKDLIEGANSNDKIKQVCNCLWEYFTRIKETQKLVMKEWIRGVMFSGKDYKKTCLNLSYVLPGVYRDACLTSTNTSANKNKKPYKVCLNAVSILFDYGYWKIKTIKDSMNLAGVKEHGLKNRVSNRFVNKADHYGKIQEGLHKYFNNLQEGAETHATRVIREATGVGLRDEEVDLVELPSSHTKRQLYHKYCFENGYRVKADAQGRHPPLKDFPLRKFDEFWPEGSVPKPVCSWKAFLTFWKENYPKMIIRPPSHDTCSECFKYKNELNTTSRMINQTNLPTHVVVVEDVVRCK